MNFRYTMIKRKEKRSFRLFFLQINVNFWAVINNRKSHLSNFDQKTLVATTFGWSKHANINSLFLLLLQHDLFLLFPFVYFTSLLFINTIHDFWSFVYIRIVSVRSSSIECGRERNFTEVSIFVNKSMTPLRPAAT